MLKLILNKPLFWILTSTIALAIIIAVFRFSSPNEQPFVLEPMSKEDLEVTIQDGKQIVDAKKDGYQLILDPDLKVVTREIESGRVMLFKGDHCEVDVSKIEDSEGKTVQQLFEEDKATEEFVGTLVINDYYIEKVTAANLEAYYIILDTEQFGVEKSIWIKGKKGIYSISESNEDKECLRLEEVLHAFSFKEET